MPKALDPFGTEDIVASLQVEYRTAVVHEEPGQHEPIVNTPPCGGPSVDIGPVILCEVWDTAHVSNGRRGDGEEFSESGFVTLVVGSSERLNHLEIGILGRWIARR